MAGYAANDDERLQIRSLDFDTRVEILYAYLVQGYNMEEVGEEILGIDNDQPGRRVSSLTRCYGFSGRNSGSYRNVSRQLIEQFVDEYWPDEDGICPIGSFDQFLRKYREAAARQEESERREREARKHAAEEEKRWAEAQRQREQEERRRRERKEQEDNKKWEQLTEQGKRALAAGKYNDAYQAFRSARTYEDTWNLNLLLAEAMAKASNAADFANDIIRELTEYEKQYKTLPVEHYHYLGEAYLAAGNKNAACTYLFKEGDVYYDRKDFARADQLYTEARKKSGYYENGHAFRIAYAHSEAKPREQLTEQDDRDCIAWYEKCRDEDGGRDDEAVYVNLAYHHNRLKEYDQSVALLKPWAERGSMNKILLGNLANACYALEQWNDAIRWYERQAQCGAERNAYEIGAAKARMGSYDEAFEEFLRYEEDDEEEAYKDLFIYIKSNGDDYELADRRVEALQAYCGFENDTDEVLSWYHEAIEAGNEYAAEQMLQEVGDLAELVAEELLDKARDALKSGNYGEARELAEKAQELDETDDGALVLAESMVRDNEEHYAREIYRLLRRKNTLNAEQFLWLAHACLENDEPDEAAQAYADAGDRWYVKNTQDGYEHADACYTEGVERTGRCKQPFRAAYSRSKAKGEAIDDEDRRYCARFYRQSAEETGDETDYANLSIHLWALKDYEQIRELLLPKAREGAKNTTLLNNLADACCMLSDYREAEQTYLLALEQTENKQETLECLALTAKAQGSRLRQGKYRLQLMQLGCLNDGEEWLLEAESAGADEIAAEMLALLPDVRRRREEEQHRREEKRRIARLKAERKRREEEALLMLMQ